MNLDKAIELLEKENRRSYPKRRLEAHIATALGIEALKRCRLARKEPSFEFPGLLPGETED